MMRRDLFGDAIRKRVCDEIGSVTKRYSAVMLKVVDVANAQADVGQRQFSGCIGRD